jgi:hypothetical protein
MKFEGIINMKKIGLVLLFIGLQSMLNAQINTTVKFKKLIYEFGNVKEESENAIAVFSFRNISNKPIWISKVETSCGCTTPEYIKEHVVVVVNFIKMFLCILTTTPICFKV